MYRLQQCSSIIIINMTIIIAIIIFCIIFTIFKH